MSETLKLFMGDQVKRKGEDKVLTILGDIKVVEFPDEETVVMVVYHEASNQPHRVVAYGGDLIQTGGVGNILLADDDGFGYLIRRSDFEDNFERCGHVEDVPLLRYERNHA